MVKHYKNGLVHGTIIYYWDNGQIRLTGQYDKMHRIGIWRPYQSNGILLREKNYNRKDKHQTDQMLLFPL